ncbi:MAG: acetylornithine aminotransferase [Porticoccaceae bacterium]|nr:MAG: acetylornithine aminotransferase [Porticoccaceae bacterium]
MTMGAFLMDTYGERPLTLVRGQGARLYDEAGREYLDALSGIAVCGLGHAHPEIAQAICEQASQLLHCSNLYRNPLQEELAARLCALTGLERAFFANSGAEANEAALKLARLFGHRRGVKTPTVVVMEHAFHGRTLATLTATGNRKVQAGFEPLVAGFARAPFGDLEALERIAENNRNVVAVLVEPIQGEGGVRIPPPGYMAGLRALCDRQGWLLMLDEVQTGNGRTGSYYHYQQHGILPDVMTTAKGLGNGFPIGACLARGEAAELFKPGSHGSTFGGNPAACAAALAVLRILERDDLCRRAGRLGERLVAELRTHLGDLPGVVEIRGSGLMIGIELDRPCAALVAEAAARGLLVNVTAERVIRLLPPLVLSEEECARLVERLTAAVRAFLTA